MAGLGVRLLCASAEGAEVERRFAAWISRWPAKTLARDFDASPRTVKAWRDGQLPQSTTMTAMVAKWGLGFLEHVFAPVLAPSDLDVSRRLDRLQSDLSALKEALHESPSAISSAISGAISGADVSASRRGLRRASRALACAITVTLMLAAALQQIAPQNSDTDMARLRHASVRVVRVAGGRSFGRNLGRNWGGRDVWA